jgi:hypothetical protein
MRFEFNQDAAYYLLVMIASLGVIGLVTGCPAAPRQRRLFSILLIRLLPALTVLVALAAFFLGEDYFHAGPVQGAEQAGLFSAAAVSATGIRALVIVLRRLVGRQSAL